MAQATVSLKLGNDYSNVRLVVSLNSSLTNPIYSTIYSTTNKMIKITISDLTENTKYYYGVVINGVLQTKGRGSFKTFQTGASNFTVAFASCARTGSTHEVFNVIKNLDPHMFIHMGDIHYSDINSNNIELFRNAYTNVLKSPVQSDLYSNVPLAYIWDDHDYGINNSDGTSISKNAASLAYREFIPHYDLAAGNVGANPIFQSFVIGRVRFIMTDLRFNKTPRTEPDDVNKTMMGELQIQWFFNELLKPEPFKVWVNSKPWIGAAVANDDPWISYTTERKRIANFIKVNDLASRMAIISGDMHGMAIDDGTNSDYADGGGAAIPVFQAAQLDQSPSTKGGPWTSGVFTSSEGGQFGIMNVTDDGINPISIEWVGRRLETVLTTHSFTVPNTTYEQPNPEPPSPPNNVTDLQIDSVSETSASLTWTSPNDALIFIILLDGVQIAEIPAAETFFRKDDLSPNTTYSFVVKAKNIFGGISDGVSIQVTTAEEITYTDIPTENLVLRIDAQETESFNFVSVGSTRLTSINDVSGQGNNFNSIGTSDPTRPRYSSSSSNYNNLPIIENAASAGMTTDYINSPFNNEFTLIMVGSLIDPNNTNTSHDVWRVISDANGIPFGVRRSRTVIGLSFRYNNVDNGAGVSSTNDREDKLEVFTFHIKNSTARMYRSSNLVINEEHNITMPTTLKFSIPSPSGFNFGEIVLYNRTVEGAELERTISYLENKWLIS